MTGVRSLRPPHPRTREDRVDRALRKPRRQQRAATRRQRPRDRAERTWWVRGERHPERGEGEVEGALRHRRLVHVAGHELELQPLRGGARAGDLQQARCVVHPGHTRSPPGRRERGVAGARREVEHTLSGPRCRALHEPLGRRRELRREGLVTRGAPVGRRGRRHLSTAVAPGTSRRARGRRPRTRAWRPARRATRRGRDVQRVDRGRELLDLAEAGLELACQRELDLSRAWSSASGPITTMIFGCTIAISSASRATHAKSASEASLERALHAQRPVDRQRVDRRGA